MPMKGARAHVNRLRALASPEATRFIGAALFAGGELIQTEAQVSITRGAISGKGHNPSAPGSPPNNDTGVLANNIETTQIAPLEVQVSSSAPYSAIHEFGGTIDHPGGTPYFMRDGRPVFVSNSGVGAYHTLPKTKPHKIIMPDRPFMRPARDKKRKEVVALVQKAMNHVVKSSKRTD